MPVYLTPEQIRFLDAAAQGDVQTVRAVLASGAGVDTPDDRRLPRHRTALMHAAANGHLEVVEILLKAGAAIDLKDKGLGVTLPGGNTALLLALKNKQVRAARQLLNAGANPNVKSGGVTVFGQAASLGDAALVRQLLKLGLDPNLSICKRADPPLASALFARQSEVVRVLLSAGANPNLRSRSGAAPLELAIKNGLVDSVQVLLHRGANPNHVSKRGHTTLMTAVLCGQKEIVKILLQRDANVNARNRAGQTALDLAQSQLDRDMDDRFIAQLEDDGLDVRSYLKLNQEIFALLRASGAKAGRELPKQRRKSSASPARARPQPAPGSAPEQTGPPLGIRDLLALANFTEPEFAVVAVEGPIGRVAKAFADLRRVRRWARNVPLQAAGRVPRGKAPSVPVVKLKHNAWTVIYRSLFRLGQQDRELAVDDARELSARLKTKAIALIREQNGESIGYELFVKGKSYEQGQWTEDGSVCRFNSRRSCKPEKDELGEDFIDRIVRRQGIYLPACYPQRRKKALWLCVNKTSARAIQRADVVVLPARS
jgi:ankyrin repeat protein